MSVCPSLCVHQCSAYNSATQQMTKGLIKLKKEEVKFALLVCSITHLCLCGRFVCYQECIGAVPTDDSDADRLTLLFRTVPVNVNWSQIDDAFTDNKTI